MSFFMEVYTKEKIGILDMIIVNLCLRLVYRRWHSLVLEIMVSQSTFKDNRVLETLHLLLYGVTPWVLVILGEKC